MKAWRGESCAPEEGGPRRRLRPETSAGISDDEVLARTNAEGRSLLTEDKDLDKLGAWLRKVELRDRFGSPSAQEARAAVLACREDLEAFASSVYEAADHGSASCAPSGP